jgi:hypothetical protein
VSAEWVCEVCERAIVDPNDRGPHGICGPCWREHVAMLKAEAVREFEATLDRYIQDLERALRDKLDSGAQGTCS